MGVSNAWGNYYAANGRVVYFDNTETKWDNIYLRIGRATAFDKYNVYCSAYQIKVGSNDNAQKVKGTANLYKYTFTNEWAGYQAFSFSNGAGWTGESNTIYQPYNDNGTIKPTTFTITGQTTFFSWNLDHTRMFIPTSVKNNEYNCTYYNTTVIDNTNTYIDYYKHNVNFYQYSAGGTLSISYIDENGNKQTKTSGSITVPQTCILTVESATAAPGYEFKNVEFYNSTTTQGDIKTVGETFIVRDARTIYPEFVTISPQKVFLKINAAWEDYKHIKVYTWNNNEYLWVDLKPVNGVSNLFSCDIPAGYSKLSFVKLNGEDAGGYHWNNKEAQSIDLDYTQVIAGKNCFQLTNLTKDDGGNDKYTGQWVGATITAKSTGSSGNNSIGIGRYGIKYNGETRYATTTQDAKFDVQIPYGENIEITALKGEPGNEAYTGYLIMNDIDTIYFSNGATDTLMNINVTGDIEFDDFFVTKEPHIVYLGVPTGDIKNRWENNNAENKSLAYAEHQYNAAHGAICLIEDQITVNNVTYYKFTIPAGWNNFRFELKSPELHDKYGNAPIHTTIRFPYGIPTDKKNCFTLTGGSGYAFTGVWEEAPQCTVTLGWPNIGRYGVKDYLDSIYYATPGKDTTFTVPYGSQVEVLEGEPRNDNYNGMVGMLSEDKKTVVERFHDGQNDDNFVTITRNTMFDDLFVTLNPHVVYLGVPNEGIDDCWHLNNTTDDIFIRKRAPYNDNLGLLEKDTKFVIDNITYYKYTLPAGLSNFQFQRKTNINDRGSSVCTSRGFIYQIPTTEYNCFILDGSKDGDEYDGYWTKLPATSSNVGHYRLLYAEKELIKTHEEGEAEDWETAFRTVYSHPSDIITTPTQTVSLHINTNQTGNRENIHPMVILQQFKEISTGTYQWVDIEAHTVLPLTARGNMAMLPGRKKAYGDLPFYSDGIDNITNDTTYQSRLGGTYKGSGVWNFKLTQGVDQRGVNPVVNLNLDLVVRYRGKYYIRTEALPDDGWNNYTGNHMTYSEYADYKSGFSHYFCKWLLTGNNVKFTIANDHAQSISDPLYADATDLRGNPIGTEQMVDRSTALDEDANVRFAWNEMNNFVHRAYLRGSTHVHDRFLVIKGEEGKIFSHPQGEKLLIGENFTPRYGLEANEEIFRDDANWIYHADVQIIPGCNATITAQYVGKEQYFIQDKPVVGYSGNASGKPYYPIRLIYDFKINRLITGYIPNGTNETNIEPITTNLMLIRTEDNSKKTGGANVSQLVFNTNNMNEVGQQAFGVLEITKDRLEDTSIPQSARTLYWISFPFDVKVSDAFSAGTYGKHWMIQTYDGAKRAREGLYLESTTNWVYHFDPNTINQGDSEYEGILRKGMGYVVALNLKNINNDNLLESSDQFTIYFPSRNAINNDIVKYGEDVTIDVPEHECTKEKRRVYDSHWNVIGVPSYAYAGAEFNHEVQSIAEQNTFYYRWDGERNHYTAVSGNKFNDENKFKSLHAYMVQYYGTLTWKNVVDEQKPSGLAAKKSTNDIQKHHLRLELQQQGTKLDHTYIQLQEDDVTSDFDFNYDLCKIINAGANIYSLIATDGITVEAAGNVLPLQTTTVPLGVIIKTAGEYTFSMPDGTDGIVAELIDYQTNTRTNLALDNYTVTLPAGTNHTRFAISLQPDKTVTGIEDEHWTADGTQVRKFLIDGRLYMQKDGVLYDAQGREIVNN